MFKILLVTVLVAVASGTLSIGLHYTESQGGDKDMDINVNTNLKVYSGWNDNLSRFKITGSETWEFYDNDDFDGQPLFVKTGPLDWTRVDSMDSAFNDRVSSVKMSGKLYIGLHYTAGQGGDRILEVNGPQNLKDAGMDNNLSRFKIPGSETWEFYDNADYAGEPLFVRTGPLDWTRVDSINAAFNDKVSSVKMPGKLYIGLHYTAGQGGDDILEVNGSQNLKGMDNNLSRFKITGSGTWEFYDNADFAGEPLFVRTGPLDWTRVDSINAAFNDKVSSVKLVG